MKTKTMKAGLWKLVNMGGFMGYPSEFTLCRDILVKNTRYKNVTDTIMEGFKIRMFKEQTIPKVGLPLVSEPDLSIYSASASGFTQFFLAFPQKIGAPSLLPEPIAALGYQYYNATKFYYVGATKIWSVTNDGTVTAVYTLPVIGGTWAKMYSDGVTFFLIASTGEVYIYRSDTGVIVGPQSLGTANDVLIDGNNILIATSSGYRVSTDRGGSWSGLKTVNYNVTTTVNGLPVITPYTASNFLGIIKIGGNYYTLDSVAICHVPVSNPNATGTYDNQVPFGGMTKKYLIGATTYYFAGGWSIFNGAGYGGASGLGPLSGGASFPLTANKFISCAGNVLNLYDNSSRLVSFPFTNTDQISWAMITPDNDLIFFNKTGKYQIDKSVTHTIIFVSILNKGKDDESVSVETVQKNMWKIFLNHWLSAGNAALLGPYYKNSTGKEVENVLFVNSRNKPGYVYTFGNKDLIDNELRSLAVELGIG